MVPTTRIIIIVVTHCSRARVRVPEGVRVPILPRLIVVTGLGVTSRLPGRRLRQNHIQVWDEGVDLRPIGIATVSLKVWSGRFLESRHAM